MSRAISRDSFNELKNYLGVYLQQGRVMLDADWNENQDLNLTFLRRMAREVQKNGTPNGGFAIHPSLHRSLPGETELDDLPPLSQAGPGHPLFLFLNLPGQELESFESLTGFSVTDDNGNPAKGHLRIVEHGQPYHGKRFLRLSGHAGTVRVMKALASAEDRVRFSTQEIAAWRFRINTPRSGTIKFILKDEAGHETRWRNTNTAFASDIWLPGFAMPLDARFHLLTSSLPPATLNKLFAFRLSVFGGQTPLRLLDQGDGLPDDLSLEQPVKRTIFLGDRALTSGSFPFTVSLVDANNVAATHKLTLHALPAGGDNRQDAFPADLTPLVETDGTPADLTKIKEYGFEFFQNEEGTLVWDLDDLRLANSELQRQAAANDFVIRGSRLQTLLSLKTIENALAGREDLFSETVAFVKSLTSSGDLTAENAGRFYVDGLPCLQLRDVLYTQQADPRDPPLTPPAAGTVRRDTVYLDAWTEPVTYIEDPEIREVALGGPDTATRTVVRHRVRVAEGAGTPTGNGMGDGRLSTEGTYVGASNRLYRVEIDTPGNPGTATFRWSDDNASTIQRVIEPVPGGGRTVVVEDASLFRSGDSILIRKKLGAEEHVIASLDSNVLTLRDVASGAPLSSTPRVERWNAFRVPIILDPDDHAFSPVVDLNDGVKVRFSGTNFVRGDYWTFRARHLAGREPQGPSADRRIEPLDRARPQGVVHHFAPLALLIRDGRLPQVAQVIDTIEDLRRDVGVHTAITSGDIQKIDVNVGLPADVNFTLARVRLTPAAVGSAYVVSLSGTATMGRPQDTTSEPEGRLDFTFSFLGPSGTGSPVIHAVGRTLFLHRATFPVPFKAPFEMQVFFPGPASSGASPLSRVPGSIKVEVRRTTSQFIGLESQVTVLELRRTVHISRGVLPRE